MPQGWYGDEADAVREREKDLGHDLDTVDLFCTEGNIKKNALSSFRRIRKGLSVDFDLCVEGSAYFASDASCFVYSIEGMQKEFNRFCLMDTEKWQEQLFHLSGYQLILWGIKPWYEWRLNANGTRAYLLCRKELISRSTELSRLSFSKRAVNALCPVWCAPCPGRRKGN